MDAIMDETSDIFLRLTQQLYMSFLAGYPSRSVVIYETTNWDNYVFVYNHGDKINLTRIPKMPIAMDQWQRIHGTSEESVTRGVFVTFDRRAGAYEDSYLHLVWPDTYRSPDSKQAKTRALTDSSESTITVGTQGRLFDL